jgi:hypothetical protein
MVTRLQKNTDGEWAATCLSRTLRHETVRRFAFVVVANGHYSVPFVPQSLMPLRPMTGHTGQVMHSTAYTHPHEFDGKRVLVVGAGPSGRDIVAGLLRWRTTKAGLVGSDGLLGRVKTMATAACAPLASPESSADSIGWSVRLPVERAARDDAGCIDAYKQSNADRVAGLPAWLRLHPQPTKVERLPNSTVDVGRTLGANGCMRVSFADARVAHYDVIICATGFRYSFPFLDGLTAPKGAAAGLPAGALVNDATGVTLVSDGHGVGGLHHNLVPKKDPSIAFATLSYGIAPFQLARAQAEFCGALWNEWRASPMRNPAEFTELWASRVLEVGKVSDGRVGLGGLMWRQIEGLLRAAGRPVGSRIPELLYLITGTLRRVLPLGEYQRVVITNLRIVDEGTAVAADAVWPKEQRKQSMTVQVPLPLTLAQRKARL